MPADPQVDVKRSIINGSSGGHPVQHDMRSSLACRDFIADRSLAFPD